MAIEAISKLGNIRSGVEPELILAQGGSSFICRLHSLQKPLRPADILTIINNINDRARLGIAVLLRQVPNQKLCHLELIIDHTVVDNESMAMRELSGSSVHEDRVAAMVNAFASTEAMLQLDGINPKIKRTALDVLTRMAKEMAPCIMNAVLSVKNRTNKRVDLGVHFSPLPVDIRILHHCVNRFGQCISDMVLDVVKGTCLVTLCIAPRMRRRKKRKKRVANDELADGAIQINENTVVFNSNPSSRHANTKRRVGSKYTRKMRLASRLIGRERSSMGPKKKRRRLSKHRN